MATPPTRVLGVTPAVGWASTASPKVTPTFDVQAGDLLVLIAFTEDASKNLAAPTWTGTGAWSSRQTVDVNNYANAYLYTCDVTATATGRTVSVAQESGTAGQYGFYVSVWRNHGGVGLSGKGNTTGAPSLALTCSANSAVVVGNSDWNAVNGATRTWRTVNGAPMAETSYGGQPAVSYVCYTGYALDVGAAGVKTLGLSAPAGQKYSIVGVEVLGGAAPPPSAFSGSASFSGSGTATPSGKPHLSRPQALSGSGFLETSGTPALGGVAALGGDGATTTSGTPKLHGDAVLAGQGVMAASGTPKLAGDTSSVSVGLLEATGSPHPTGPISLSGEGTTTIGTTERHSGAVLLGGTGAITASGTPRPVGSVSVVSTGLPASAGTAHVTGSALFSGTGTVVAGSGAPSTRNTYSASIAPRRLSATLIGERRITATLQPTRWAGKLK